MKPPLSITDLGFGQCRFPVTPFDAPKHFFCGEPVEYEKCPYCPTHAARCFDRRTAERKKADALRAEMARAGKKVQQGHLPPSLRHAAHPKF